MLRSTLRDRLSITIGLMGMSAFALMIVAVNIYRETAINHHRAMLEQVLARSVKKVTEQLHTDVVDLAVSLQSEKEFRGVLANKRPEAIHRALAQQFQRQFANDGNIKLVRIAVYDNDFRHISTATESMLTIEDDVACGTLVAQASARQGIQRSKSMSTVCTSRGRAYFSTLVPIGGLRPRGFIQIETEPVAALAQLESELRMPIRLVAPNRQPIFQSPNWPNDLNNESHVYAEYIEFSNPNEPMLKIVAASDSTDLFRQLSFTAYSLLFATAAITLLTAILARVFFQRAVISPLNNLSTQLKKICGDKAHMGEQVKITGDQEVRQLSSAFNTITSELRNLYGTLQYVAFTDPLTHLPNRLQLQENLDNLISLFGAKELPFALVMIDLNRFRQVNDSLGRIAGNIVLQTIATRLRDTLRSTDIVSHIDTPPSGLNIDNVARLGSDEFAAILPLVGSVDQAERAAEKALLVMRKPIEFEGRLIKVDITIGVAIYPSHGSTATNLLRSADIALYEAKRRERAYAIFDSETEYHVVRQLDLEHDLHNALSRGQLNVHYQPQVEMKTRRVVGVEALLRWHHLDQDMIPPDFFIPLAEQIDMIRPLTLWALEQAIRDCARWRAAGHLLTISVNVSPICLHDVSFVATTLRLLQKWDLAPEFLTLEFTERGHHGQLPRTLPALNALKSAGVRLSIDDFGTGYPTLAQLNELPVSQLKIDKNFVLEMLQNPGDAGIVRSTIEIAHARNLEVVAEGVELQAHWDLLAEYGVDIAQGYVIAHPLSYTGLLNWIQANTLEGAVWIPQSSVGLRNLHVLNKNLH